MTKPPHSNAKINGHRAGDLQKIFLAIPTAGGAAGVLDFRFSFQAVVAAWIVFGLAHSLVRIGQPSRLADVDGLSMMAAQSFSLAYQVSQPPLYDWALWLVQQLTGPIVISVYLTKYAFMTTAGAFIYYGALAISGERRLAALASISLLLLSNVGFTVHDMGSHSVALIATVAATFYFYVMIAQRGCWRDYVGLGLALAAGTLSKFGYLIFPTSLALAFLYSPALRGRILSWRFVGSLALGTLLVSPFAWWLAGHAHDFALKIDNSLIKTPTGSYLQRTSVGLQALLLSLFYYCLPVFPLIFLLFPQLLKRGMKLSKARDGALADVLGLALLIGLAIAVSLVVLAGVSRLHARYMHVLALLLPVYAVLYLKPQEARGWRLATFIAILVGAQGAALAQRALSPFFPYPPFCNNCDFLKPVDQLANYLSSQNLSDAIIWVEHDLRLGGNLRVYLPRAQIRTARLWAKALPARATKERCIMIVQDGYSPSPTHTPPKGYDPDAVSAKKFSLPWPRRDDGRESTITWIVQPLAPDDPRCSDME